MLQAYFLGQSIHIDSYPLLMVVKIILNRPLGLM